MYNPKIIRLPKNRYVHRDFLAGDTYETQINVGIGTSTSKDTFENELKKAITAESTGANIITDHSICGNISEFHQMLRNNITVPLSTVSIYELAIRNECFSDIETLDMIEEHLFRGFNLLTLHATVLEQDIHSPITKNRLIPITSKGGLIMLKRIEKLKQENPYYSRFDDILKIFKKYNAIISLGPTYRPGSVIDNSMVADDAYWIEMQRMSILVKKAVAYEVPIIIEGIGHARLDKIPEYISKSKEMCSGVPYRVLTVSTDIALGYDNISSAIASAVAVLNGANIITAVTSAEHIGLPTNEQIEEAVITAKIAAHSAELCKNDCIDRDRRMSITRMKIGNCQGSIDESIYPQGAKKALLNNESHMPGCSMCGRFCALIKE